MYNFAQYWHFFITLMTEGRNHGLLWAQRKRPERMEYMQAPILLTFIVNLFFCFRWLGRAISGMTAARCPVLRLRFPWSRTRIVSGVDNGTALKGYRPGSIRSPPGTCGNGQIDTSRRIGFTLNTGVWASTPTLSRACAEFCGGLPRGL